MLKKIELSAAIASHLMRDSNPVFNYFPCPRCGASVPLKLRLHKFNCPDCDWQGSMFQTAAPVTSDLDRATKITTPPVHRHSPRPISTDHRSKASKKATLPRWLCVSPYVYVQKPPAIAPDRSKIPLRLITVAIAAVIITTLNLLNRFRPNFDLRLLFSPPAPYEEAVAVPPEDAFRQGVNAAMKAAILTQSARTQMQWQMVGSWWSEAIALMEGVPSQSPDRPVAEQKAIEYQANWSYAQQQLNQIAYAPPPPPPLLPMPVTNAPLLPPPPPAPAPSPPPQPQERFRYAVNQAMSAASLTQWAETREDWHQITQEWSKAIALMKSVPSDSRDYSTAQQKAQEYQTNLLYAQKRARQLSP